MALKKVDARKVRFASKRGPKTRFKKGSVAVRLLLPSYLSIEIDVMAKKELRPKTSMIHVLLIEALNHRSKSAS